MTTIKTIKGGAIPGRTVIRNRGCWSCTGWDNGELAKKHYSIIRLGIVARLRQRVDMLRRRMEESISKEPGFYKELGKYVEQGKTEDEAINAIISAKIAQMSDQKYAEVANELASLDNQVNEGMWGICMKGKAPGDFCHAKYLCEGWNGRQGHSLATANEPLDKLPDELYDIMDDKLPKG